MTTKVLLIATLTACTLALGACNTLHGIGKDIRIGGQQLENAAGGNDDTK